MQCLYEALKTKGFFFQGKKSPDDFIIGFGTWGSCNIISYFGSNQ